MTGIRNSLRAQLLASAVIALTFIVVSMSYVLLGNLRFQNLADERFQTERYFQNLQGELISIQEPLTTYLSTRSSTSLAQLLGDEQNIRSMLPVSRPVEDDFFRLESREIFFLIDTYLNMIQDAISLKRARAIDEYTSLYDRMSDLNAHIASRIDEISLFGLRRELDQYEQIMAVSRQLLYWNFLVIISGFLTAVFLILLSVNRITTPLQRLATAAGELAESNFELDDIEVRAVSEVGALVVAFNRMKDDIRSYIAEVNRQKQIEQGYLAEKVRNLRMEQLLKRMELYTLQAQMNPHFLFNTLNTGVQLAIQEDADRTAEYMENLAAYFRHIIRERNLVVPLRHEVESLTSYLYILKIRFARSLSFPLQVPEHLLDECEVPALVLQPLVENAVIHAFPESTEGGRIEVLISRSDALLHLVVKDNGVGMDEQTIHRLFENADADLERSSKTRGLENVIHRLHALFPEQADSIITIDSNPGSGTEIRISIDTRVGACIPS